MSVCVGIVMEGGYDLKVITKGLEKENRTSSNSESCDKVFLLKALGMMREVCFTEISQMIFAPDLHKKLTIDF